MRMRNVHFLGFAEAPSVFVVSVVDAWLELLGDVESELLIRSRYWFHNGNVKLLGPDLAFFLRSRVQQSRLSITYGHSL